MLDVAVLLIFVIPLESVPYFGHESLLVRMAARSAHLELTLQDSGNEKEPGPYLFRSSSISLSRSACFLAGHGSQRTVSSIKSAAFWRISADCQDCAWRNNSTRRLASSPCASLRPALLSRS